MRFYPTQNDLRARRSTSWSTTRRSFKFKLNRETSTSYCFTEMRLFFTCPAGFELLYKCVSVSLQSLTSSASVCPCAMRLSMIQFVSVTSVHVRLAQKKKKSSAPTGLFGLPINSRSFASFIDLSFASLAAWFSCSEEFENQRKMFRSPAPRSRLAAPVVDWAKAVTDMDMWGIDDIDFSATLLKHLLLHR